MAPLVMWWSCVIGAAVLLAEPLGEVLELDGVADMEPGCMPSAGHGSPGVSWNLAACAAVICLLMELPFCSGC
jgi:hypothetical protein